MIDPIWQLARRSLGAGFRNGDLKETCFAEKRICAVAWSRALYQSADQRLKDCIIFAVVQDRQWTPQRLHDDELGMSFRDHLLPMRRGQCIVSVKEKAMLNPVHIGNLVDLWARFAKSEANVRVEIHVPQERAAMEPVIVGTCCRFEGCDI